MPDNSTVATQTLKAEPGKAVTLPAGDTAANAEFTRDGQDLCLTSDGHMVRIEGYFAQDPAPDIVSADGSARFTPQLVDSFLPPQHPGEYAQAAGTTAVDLTGAVGKITKVEGEATIIRADGTKVKAELGAIIFQGDVITTGEKGAVNIIFADNTSFSISRNAKLAVDEFEYDPQEHSGTSFFSMLQGVFVYQSGDIGKDDPSKVNINTPVGSIGIRGTLVAGEINPPGQESKVTIVDGAVIITNGGGELVLNDTFETATLTGYNAAATNAGQLDSNTFSATYSSVAPVAANTFSAVANGTYQSTSPQASPVEGTQPQQPVSDVNAQPDGTQVTPPTDGTVSPDANGSTPTDGTVAPPPDVKQTAPTDGTVAPPPPAAPVQDGMILQPLPGTQIVDGALTQPTAGSTFTSPVPGSFPTASGSTFTDSTTPALGGTGGTGGTTTVLPPPPPPPTGGTTTVGTNPAPPVPTARFVFAPFYLNGTPGDTSDDGVPIFGTGLNATVAAPVMIGHIQLLGFAQAPTVTITGGGNYNPATGQFNGTNLSFTTTTLGDPTTTTGSGTIMYFEPDGRLMLSDPTGMITNLNNNGVFSFSINVTDAGGTTYLNNSFVVNVKQDTGTNGYVIKLGDHGTASTTVEGQLERVDNFADTTTPPNTDDMLIAGGGSAFPLFDNQLASTSGGNDALIGGMGRDLLAVTHSTGTAKIFGMGGDDTLKFHHSNVFHNMASTADGGDGTDTLILGNISGGQNFNFLANNNRAFNIERLMIEGGGAGNQVRLDVSDVFEMTGPSNHVLRIGMVGTGTAQLFVDNSDTLVNNFQQTGTGAGTVTYTALHNNQTVTLIIETSNPSLTVTVV